MSRGRIVPRARGECSTCESGFEERLQNHRRSRGRGQLRRDQRQPLLHELSSAHQVRVFLKDQDDRREAEHRFRAQGFQLSHAVERVFDWSRDEAFDFGCGKAGRFGLDFDQRRRELGEDVERRRANDANADDHQRNGQHDDDDAQMERCRN